MINKKKWVIVGCIGAMILGVLGYFINFKTMLFEISTMMMMVMEGIIKPIIGILFIIVLVKVIRLLDEQLKKDPIDEEKNVLDRECLLEVIKKINIEQLDLEEGPASIVLKNNNGKKLSVTLEKVNDQIKLEVGKFLFKKKYYYTYEELI